MGRREVSVKDFAIKGLELQFPAHSKRWYTEAQIVAALEMYDGDAG